MPYASPRAPIFTMIYEGKYTAIVEYITIVKPNLFIAIIQYLDGKVTA